MENKKVGQKYKTTNFHVTLHDESGKEMYCLFSNSVVQITDEQELRTVCYNEQHYEVLVYPVKILSGVVKLPPYSKEDLQSIFPNRHDPQTSQQVFDVVSGFILVNESRNLKKL